MTAPQIIRAPSGEELVVLPRAEYEALLERAENETEDVADVAIYNARKGELAVGGVVLPPEVGAAILRGESRLKAVRNWRGETQLHLNSRPVSAKAICPISKTDAVREPPRPWRSSRRRWMCRWNGFRRRPARAPLACVYYDE
jgi:hypothetical protein